MIRRRCPPYLRTTLTSLLNKGLENELVSARMIQTRRISEGMAQKKLAEAL